MVNLSLRQFKTSYVNGFTLIEIMIVVLIVGILTIIALPMYVGYRERTIRVEAMTELLQIGGRIESQKINYRRYDNIPLNTIFSNTIEVDGSVKHPSTGSIYYIIEASPINTAKNPATLNGKNWELTATPVATSIMSGDGVLSFDSNGIKCRNNKCGLEDQWNY